MGLILYFLRHGQTALSREDVFCGSGLDPELTPEGMEMARAFAKTYREAEWHAVYTSSLRRSITTAQPLCDALEINLQVTQPKFGPSRVSPFPSWIPPILSARA